MLAIGLLFISCNSEPKVIESVSGTTPEAGPSIVDGAPTLQPVALAVMAQILLEQGRNDEALAYAQKAFDAVENAEGSEFLIRLRYAETLKAMKQDEKAGASLSDTLKRLRKRANSMIKFEWRKSFLENVEENVRIQVLGQEWLSDSEIDY